MTYKSWMPRPPSTSLSPLSVLEAAKNQVRRFGEAKTNMVDIARVIGVSHAALYRFYKTKSALMDAIVQEVMNDEAKLAAAYVHASGPAAQRLLGMFLDLHRRKRERFVGDREIHDLHRRILVERPDMVIDYARRITNLVQKLIEQAVERQEWKVDDTAKAAGVVCNAMITYVHPVLVAQLISAGAPVEDMLRASLTTLARAFEAGVSYGPSRRKRAGMRGR